MGTRSLSEVMIQIVISIMAVMLITNIFISVSRLYIPENYANIRSEQVMNLFERISKDIKDAEYVTMTSNQLICQFEDASKNRTYLFMDNRLYINDSRWMSRVMDVSFTKEFDDTQVHPLYVIRVAINLHLSDQKKEVKVYEKYIAKLNEF